MREKARESEDASALIRALALEDAPEKQVADTLLFPLIPLSCSSRRSCILSPLWTPQVCGPTSEVQQRFSRLREAWPVCRTSSDVRLCWELEEPEGPEGPFSHPHRSARCPSSTILRTKKTTEGSLTLKKTLPPLDHRRGLGIDLL